MQQDQYKFFKNFQSRTDLEKYGDNALLLYSLQLRYGIEDIDEVASTSLLDDNDDKKTDLLYIDTEFNEAIIAQGFFGKKKRTEAPSNKASDLNTAVTWLLTREIKDLPAGLQSAAKELRRTIADGEIKRITIWYSHNYPESENNKQELRSANNTLSSILAANYPDSAIDTGYVEVGLNTLEDWYLGLTIPILVTDTIRFDNVSGYEVVEDGWSCFNSHVQANIIYDLYKDHGAKLFSANVRDYLGSRKSDSNINNGIKITAEKEPVNFFVYNNGITALVNSFTFNGGGLTVKGLSIVNGAQTTGALGSLSTRPDPKIKIPIRLIKCDNPDTVANIVKFNNSQNKINAPDFRSSDTVQRRLINEFNNLDVIEYASRRGGAIDTIKRNANILPSVTAGQILAAFHNEPSIAYNEKSKIWESDKLYSYFFNEQTTAKHIVFIFTLLKKIEEYKLKLLSKSEPTTNDLNALALLRTRGAIVLIIAAISRSIEEILGKKVNSLFALQFHDNLTIEEGMEIWSPVLDMVMSFSTHLASGLSDGIKNRESIDKTLSLFKQFMSAVRASNEGPLGIFVDNVIEG